MEMRNGSWSTVNGAVTHPGGAAEKSAMRTAESLLRALLISGLLAAAPAHALDGAGPTPAWVRRQ